jgi:hypothetical protein
LAINVLWLGDDPPPIQQVKSSTVASQFVPAGPCLAKQWLDIPADLGNQAERGAGSRRQCTPIELRQPVPVHTGETALIAFDHAKLE